MKKIDIREYGSGNAGTTNTLRVLGKGPAILVLLFDVIKAVAAIGLAWIIIEIGENTQEASDIARCIAGLAVIIGHNFPIYYGFKGGKGIATSLGTILTIEPRIGLICLIFALVIMLVSRMVSLGSISAALLYPVLVLVMGESISNKAYYLIFALLLSILAIWRHRANIERIKNGTENKLWSKKEKTVLK
jgi:glycerol-3-phosphate acyltransferase PlsY